MNTERERRNHQRYQVKDGTLALNSTVLGPVLNISLGGMLFEYYSNDLADEAIVTLGSKEGLAHLALATTGPGDAILVPNPSYPIHPYGFVISGADTEVDKLITEELSDPLMHLIRNSIDHGIEMPDERRKHGKSESGIVLLKAYHEAGQVVIEISDDGKGINGEALAASAVKKGLLTVEQAKAENPKGKQFSYARFKELINANKHLDTESLKEILIKELKSFVREDFFEDDVTFILVKILE